MTGATAVPPDDNPRITLSSPADLAAATPYLLGFHPADSLVVLAFRGRTYVGLTRADLGELAVPADGGPPGRPAAPLDPAALLDPAARQDATTVAVLGYGPVTAADPAVTAVCAAAERRGLRVKEALRVHAGRWWSYMCRDPRCCPAAGTPFDTTTSEVAVRCAVEGMTALPSRADLERRIAPLDGAARAAMDRATDRAHQRHRRLLAACAESTGAEGAEPELTRRVRDEGAVTLATVLARYTTGGTVTDDELAWLAVLLTSLEIRDLAWQTITAPEPHLSLWTDVTRRADPSLVVAPACLLAFTAWRFGEPVLAGMALERALQVDPGYPMAQLLADGLRQGPPPPAFDNWGSPAWPESLDHDLAQRAPDAPPEPRPPAQEPTRDTPV